MTLATATAGGFTLLPTALAGVSADKTLNNTTARLLLDSGAERTVIAYQLWKRIRGGSLMSTGLSVSGVGGAEAEVMGEVVFRIHLIGSKVLVKALVMSKVGITLPPVPDLHPYFPSLRLSDSYDRERDVEIILGQDLLWRIWFDKHITSLLSSRLVATSTALGWVPQGSTLQDPEEQVDQPLSRIGAAQVQPGHVLDKLASQLDSFLTLEGLGIKAEEEDSGMKPLDKLALKMFNENLHYDPVSKRYSSELLFRPDHGDLVSNRRSAENRFLSVERKFQRDEKFAQAYEKGIMEYFEKGFAEWVEESEEPARAIYLPHSAVLKDSSTTDFRIVFDASCYLPGGGSLNLALLTGDLGKQDLLKLILKFRLHRIAICGDISKMYLAVALRNESDRDCLRFLWRSSPTEPFKVGRMTCLTFGVADAAFQAIETVKHHASKYVKSYPLEAKMVLEDRWVDDLISGCDKKEKAISIIRNIQSFMASGGFKFRKWMSNSPEVMAQIPVEDRADLKDPINFDDAAHPGRVIKALGTRWNPKFDWLRPIAAVTVKEKAPTRTTLASGMAQIFDPMGLASPFTITAKLLNQEAWEGVELPKHPTKQERKKVWNETLKGSILERWNDWVEQVPTLDSLEIPRCVFVGDEAVKRELHLFGDASPRAFGAVAYVVTSFPSGKVVSRFVVAKARVAPAKKKETLPRLELIASLTASRLLRYLRNEVGLDYPAILWTDSAITYHWLHKDVAGLTEFISRRVREIKEDTKDDHWRHVPGVLNPADLATRGITAAELAESRLWKHGPQFLEDGPASWPENHFAPEDLDKDALQKESKKKVRFELDVTRLPVEPSGQFTLAAISRSRKCPCSKNCDRQFLMGLENKFSDWLTLLRVTVYVMRFAGVLERSNGEIQPVEIEEALLLWVKYMQEQELLEEMLRLKKGQQVQNESLAKAAPFIDGKGFMRAGGRLDQGSDLPYDLRHPLILPHRHRLTKLLILWVHEKHWHQGPEWTLYHIRHRFWFIKARRTVKSALRSCILCLRWKKVLQKQLEGQIPEERLLGGRPFERCGVDFAGPYEVFETREDGSVEKQKVWICLFTCMSTRAVSTDLVVGLSTETFLLAFRRLTARFGQPALIWSDNATTFTAAANEIQALWSPSSQKKTRSKLLRDGTVWKFISPSSPWQGGFWERMVGLVKEPLKKTFFGRILPREEFRTILAECEAYVNSRPLADVSEAPDEPLPVTPAQLILGYNPVGLPGASTLKGGRKSPLMKWKSRLAMVEEFKKRFKKDYLLDLLAHKRRPVEESSIEVGDVVLIFVEDEPRGGWPLAVVTELITGRDGLVRNVWVRTAKGLKRRSVQRLVKLEVNVNESTDLD